MLFRSLFFDGARIGDTQATALGMLSALCFLFISRGTPPATLSSKRPTSNLFHPSTVISIILQMAVHMASIVVAVSMAKESSPPMVLTNSAITNSTNSTGTDEIIDGDSPFAPSLLNSVVFLVSCAMQVSSFAVNHRGRPFMQGLTENRGLLFCLLALSGITWISALEVSPEWNSFFELVPFPTAEFRWMMIAIMAFDCVGAWVLDRLICLAFKL